MALLVTVLPLVAIEARATEPPAGPVEATSSGNLGRTPGDSRAPTSVGGRSLDDRPVIVPEPTPQAVAYHHSGNVLWVVGRAWALAIPALWLLTGLGARWRDRAMRAKPRVLGVGLFALGYFAASWLLELPFAQYAGFIRPHAYGLSRMTWPAWFADEAKAFGFELLLSMPLAIGTLALIRHAPRLWWAIAGAVCVPGVLGLAFLMPIWVDPAFNHFDRLHDRALEEKILALAHRAGIEADRVYEVDMSRKTRTANAYVTGLLGTSRIVLWDTLLERLEDDEILAVMGHEMGHYALGHVVSGVLVSCLLVGVGMFVVDRTARWLVRRRGDRWGIPSLGDPAALPLLLLVGQAVALVLTPVGYAYSRRMEHEADRFALELTHDNAAAARAFVALQRENLGYPRPSTFYRLIRSTHPSLGERIDFCNSYRPWAEGKPLRYADRFRRD